MLEKVKQTTTTYKYQDDYFIDIVEQEDWLAAFFYRGQTNQKFFITGHRYPKNISYEWFVNEIEENIEDYIYNYNNQVQLYKRFLMYANQDEMDDEESDSPSSHSFITKKGELEGHEFKVALVKDDTTIESYRFDTNLAMIRVSDNEDDEGKKEEYRPNDFAVDIVEEEDRYVAWVYHKDYGTKLATVAVGKENMTKEQFIAELLDNALHMMSVFMGNGMSFGKRLDREDEQD